MQQPKRLTTSQPMPSAMPRNKTGLFVSEIITKYIRHPVSAQHISSNNDLNKMDYIDPLSFNENLNYETAEFRNHSAFRIKVKPRPALASANVKLMEQRQRVCISNNPINKPHRTSAQSKALSQKHDHNLEEAYANDYKEINSSSVNKQELEDLDTYMLLTKDAFRPSAVLKKRTKTPSNSQITFDETNQLNREKTFTRTNTSHSLRQLKKLTVSLADTNGYNKSNVDPSSNEIDHNNEFDSMPDPKEIFLTESKVNFNKIDPLPLKKVSNTQLNNLKLNTSKTSLDLFKEVLDSNASNNPSLAILSSVKPHPSNISINTNLNSSKHLAITDPSLNKLGKLARSKTLLDPPAYNANNNYNNFVMFNQYLDEQNQQEQSEIEQELLAKTTSEIVNNLNETEFLEVLKEYRKTKNINLNNMLLRSSNTNDMHNTNTNTPVNLLRHPNDLVGSRTATELKIPCHFLTLQSASNQPKFFPLIYHNTNLLNTNANKSTAHSHTTSALSTIAPYYNGLASNELNNIPSAKLLIESNNKSIYINSKTPNYLTNYLNKKLLIRNPNNTPTTLINHTSSNIANKLNDNTKSVVFNELNAKNINSSSLATQNRTTTSEKKLQCLKILNFPEVAN